MTRLVQLSTEQLGARLPLAGATAFDGNGERLGTVAEVIADAETLRPRYLVVASSGLLRSKQFVVPAELIERIDEEQHSVSLRQVTRSQLGSDPYPVYDDGWWGTDGDDRLGPHEAARAQSYDPARVAPAPDGYSVPPMQPAADVGAQLQLLEERLTVRTERVQAGSVRISKRVVSRTETVEVPLTEVHLVIERTAGDGSITVDGRELAEGETVDLPIYTERVRVTKEPVVAEQVRIRTEAAERIEQVSETLRREELVVDQNPDGLALIVDQAGTPRRDAAEAGAPS